MERSRGSLGSLGFAGGKGYSERASAFATAALRFAVNMSSLEPIAPVHYLQGAEEDLRRRGPRL